MILVLNGPFGVGKTTLAEALVAANPAWLLIDVEEVGQMLRRMLGDAYPLDDFQDYQAWAPLVVATVREISVQTGRPLVLPICISSRERFAYIRAGIEDIDSGAHFVCLVADAETIRRRLAGRGDQRGSWAEVRVDPLCDAFSAGDWGVRLDGRQSVEELLLAVARMTSPESE